MMNETNHRRKPMTIQGIVSRSISPDRNAFSDVYILTDENVKYFLVSLNRSIKPSTLVRDLVEATGWVQESKGQKIMLAKNIKMLESFEEYNDDLDVEDYNILEDWNDEYITDDVDTFARHRRRRDRFGSPDDFENFF